MGHIDGGRFVFQVQPLQLGAHFFAELGVEGAHGFVHEHGLWTAHQRATDGHALHVSACKR